MDARTYWKAARPETSMRLCQMAGTTYNYWQHLCHYRRRPSVDLARRLVAASRVLTPHLVRTLEELLVPREALCTPHRREAAMTKTPAFQFYPAAFLADEKVALMDNRELGCYIKLLCYCWREGSIPAHVKLIARLCGEDGSAMADLWIAISYCFTEAEHLPNRLVHPRIERERQKQESFRKERADSGKKGAAKRWSVKNQVLGEGQSIDSSAMAEPMAKPMAVDGSSSSSSSLNKKKRAPDVSYDWQANTFVGITEALRGRSRKPLYTPDITRGEYKDE